VREVALKMKEVSRILLGLFYVYNIILLLISKRVILAIIQKRKKQSHNVRNILIVGSKHGAEAIIKIINSSSTNINIIGCIDIKKKEIGKAVKNNVKVIGVIKDVHDFILDNVVDEIIFTMPLKLIESIDAYIILFELLGINVRIFGCANLKMISKKGM